MMPQALKMRCPNRVLTYLLATALLMDGGLFSALSKSYSSGGKSYSSHSSSSGSSHSFSSGSGKSFSSGSGSRSSSGGSSRSSSSGSSGGSRSSSSPSGSKKSYSSGSSWNGSDRHGYSSGKSYSSGSSSAYKLQSPKAKDLDSGNQNTSTGSGFSFDTAAARARKEEASKQEFTQFKDSQAPPRVPDSTPSATPKDYAAPVSGGGSYRASPPPLLPRRDYYQPTYVPTTVIIQTRPRRIYDVFSPYTYRPWVTYNDPYSSLFWWWLLDRSIDDQAWWAYHHRYDMDPARYQALLNSNQQLEARVAQLEAQQPARDPTYTPTGLNGRDLMYSDQYVNRTYANRPTPSGTVAFWIFAVPAAAGGCIFFIWLIWFKRWQTT